MTTDHNTNLSGKVELAVCVPLSWSSVPREFFVSYTGLFVTSRMEAMEKAGLKKLWHLFDPSFPLDLSRNRLVKGALDLGATHVLFLDADMMFPKNLIEGLLETNADVAGALYFKKRVPYQPVPAVFDNKEDAQLMGPIRLEQVPGPHKCDVLGMGATMIKREVFEKIGHPWFAYDTYKPSGETTVTEDVTFCTKAQAAGFEIICDTRLVCGHVRSEIVGPNHWEMYRSGIENETVPNEEKSNGK